MDVAAWLRDLGLERYAAAFRDNDIGEDLLPTLTDAELRELGVVSLGHRKRLLNAILALPEPEAHATPSPRAARHSLAERRQVTVLFCDLVGSTELARALDPEDFEAVVRSYQDVCGGVVSRHGGRLFEFLGDGVLVCFGHPKAHENDTERAVRAGLDLAERVGSVILPNGDALRARIGIATGLVVAGRTGAAGDEPSILGETPSLASRLQAVAEPGTVVIDDATRRLIGGLFDFADLGPMTVKGVNEPLNATQVLSRRAIDTRSEMLHARSTSARLIGRDQEIELLLHRWRQVQRQEGHVALLSGEPGIGKSRVAAALVARLAGEEHGYSQCFCSPDHQSSALFPVIRHLEQASGFERADSMDRKRQKLDAMLLPAAERSDGAGMIAGLLALPERDPPSFAALGSQRRKQMLLDALVTQLLGEASQKPVLLLFEDAHWIDPTSLELLELAVERIRRLPVLLVITFRPEFHPPWAGLSHVTALTLSGLGRAEAAMLVEQTADGRALTDVTIAEIVDRTDGIPLFVEELTRTIAEGNGQDVAARHALANGSAAMRAVPAALHAPLMSRFDRLGPAKAIAQVGAAIGREFSYELLAAVAPMAEAGLQDALARLVESGIVSRRGHPPSATFQFKHALVQDAAYGTMLHTTRRDLHTRIVRAIESGFPDVVEAQPELLARHCTQADLIEAAVGYWSKAGQRAIARSAMQEGAASLRRAIELLSGLPDTPARQRHELDFTTLLGTALIAAKGYTDAETGRAYARARVLCAELGDPSRLIAAVRGQCSYHLVRGEVPAVLAAATDLLAEAERRDSREMRLTAHQLLGIGVLYAGRLHHAREHLATAAALLAETGDLAARVPNGRDAVVGIPCHRAILLVLLGEYDEARAQNTLGLSMARQQARPHRLAFALATTIWFHTLLNEDASSWVTELRALSGEQGYPYWKGFVQMCQGIALCQGGDAAAGIALARRGVAQHDLVGAAWSVPILLVTLAAAVGDEDATPLIDEAFARTEDTGVQFYEPEHHRLRARIMLGAGDAAGAEAHYLASLRIARQQGAVHWQVRTASDFARMLHQQGRHAGAQGVLAEACGILDGTSNTIDIQRARVLLRELMDQVLP